MKKFSISEAVSFGWNTFKANVGFLLGLMFVLLIINFVPSMIVGAFTPENPAEVQTLSLSLLNLIIAYFQTAIGLGLMKISLDFVDGKKPSMNVLFSYIQQIRFVIRYFGASLLVGLIILGGFLLFIIPGIIWSLKYGQYKYLLLDQNIGIMDSIKRSGQITQGAKMDLFLFGIVAMGISFLGIIVFVVGLFAAIPVLILAEAFIYRQLVKNTKAAPAKA